MAKPKKNRSKVYANREKSTHENTGKEQISLEMGSSGYKKYASSCAVRAPVSLSDDSAEGEKEPCVEF